MNLILLKISFLSFIFGSYECKCVNTFTNICETVSDLGKSGRKHWTNLIIQTDHKFCLDVSENVRENREQLKNDTFEKLPNLEELYIVDRLDEIELGAFQHLTNLQYLNLFKNRIKEIKVQLFINSQEIYKIELEFNGIMNVEKGAFHNLPKLKTLNLANNYLNLIETQVFNNIKNLRKLILSSNLIATINHDSFPGNLEILNLNENKLQELDEKLFSNLNRLKELDLSGNNFKKLRPNLFTGLDNLFKLDLSHNQLETIEVKTFGDLREMKLLQLAHNQLRIIKPDIFAKNNAMTLQSIRLDHNKLTFLSAGVLDRLRALRRISIGGNPWQCVCLRRTQTEMSERNVNYTPCDIQHYFTGKHPNCIQFRQDECVENVQVVGDDFQKSYANELQNFSYDCP